MTRPATDPEFLSPEGERAWTWLRRHLDRANAFWLAFVLTDDLTAQRVLRERVRANRRLRAHPLTILQPATPAELAGLLDELEARGAPPPGCTWVAAPQLADDEWLAAWRTFLLAMNHRRDVLRARLGGLVIAAPSAVKLVAQRESPDLWSVRDLLVELAARPVAPGRAAGPRGAAKPRQVSGAQGLSYESADAELADEAQVLLAMPVMELAGPARERTSRAVHRAMTRDEHQLAAVLLLAQSDGYRAAGDPAGALDLVREGLTLDGIEPRTRERFLAAGVELATDLSELELARQYAAESVALIEQRVSPHDLDALSDLAWSITGLGDVTCDLGDPTTARTHHQQALAIRRQLADQLDTPQALSGLAYSLTSLGDVTRDLGDLATARTHHQQALAIRRQLAEQLNTPQAHRDLAYSLASLGYVTRDLGDLGTARSHHKYALDIFQRLAKQLATPPAMSDFVIALVDLGDAVWELVDDPATARTYYQQALPIDQRLAEQLATPQALLHFSVTLERLGDIARYLGELPTAHTHYQQALAIRQQLADQLDTPQALSGLAWSLTGLGDVARNLGDLAAAHTHYQQALAIRQQLADQLDTPQAHRDLAYSLVGLGYVTRDLGDLATAHTHHQSELAIFRRLAEQLGTAPALRDLQEGLDDLARTEEELGNADAAAALRAERATVEDRLTALRDDVPDSERLPDPRRQD